MPLPDLADAIRLSAAPALLAMILLAHVAYYRRHRASDGQQVIALTPLAEEPALIAADSSSFNPQTRTVAPTTLSSRPCFLGLDRHRNHLTPFYGCAPVEDRFGPVVIATAEADLKLAQFVFPLKRKPPVRFQRRLLPV